MVRPKGGKRQPRYHALKNAGAERMCALMEARHEPAKQERELDIITRMSLSVEAMDLLLLAVTLHVGTYHKERAMFICQKCGKMVGPGVSPVKVVTATRTKEYPQRWSLDEQGNKDELIDRGGVGREIVSEENRCAECAK